MNRSEHKGWYYSHYLPHFDGSETAQFITFRLADSLPSSKLHILEEEIQSLKIANKELEKIRKIEAWLDRGEGECWLSKPKIASLVQETLLLFHEEKYQLHAWIIMSNHVHVLITPGQGNRMETIVHSWKSYTAKKGLKRLGNKGSFWQSDYFDRFIRSEKHFHHCVHYIEENPVKAGLCSSKEKWVYSSAYKRLEPRDV